MSLSLFEPMIEDTSQAVCDEAKATLDRIRGPLRARVVEIIGEAGYQRFFKGSQARIRALESKSLVHCRSQQIPRVGLVSVRSTPATQNARSFGPL